MIAYYITKVKLQITEDTLDYILQPGAIWTTGVKSRSTMAQVMHFNKEKNLVFCIQKTNYGYKDIDPDTYDLDQFLECFAFVGVKK